MYAEQRHRNIPGRARADRAGPAELFGRDDELELLTGIAEQAGSGSGRAVLLRGPAGIGKTGLLHAALGRLAPVAARTLRARCPDAGSGAYGAVRDLFQPLGFGTAAEDSVDASRADASRADAPGADALRTDASRPEALQTDAPRLEATQPDAPRPDALRGSARLALPALQPDGLAPAPSSTYAVLHGLHWLVAGLTADGLLVLAVDDVQWCDENSLRWLAFLLRRAEDLPLLVLLTQRTGDGGAGPEMLGEIAEMPLCRTVDLPALGARATGELLAASAGSAPDEHFAARCAQLTGGNPFLLGMVAARLREHPGEGWDPVVLEELGRTVVAPSLVEGLPARVLAVARAIAVLPGEQPELIAALARTHQRTVSAAVRELGRRDLVTEAADGCAEFVHDSVRQAVLRDSPDEVLRRLRERAATLLNDVGRPAEEVAVPLLLLPAAPRPWMTDVLREAAGCAEHRGAPGMAARYLRRVLEFDGDDVAVLVQCARMLGQLEPETALRQLERALELLDEPRSRVPVAAQYALISLTAQNSVRAYELTSGVLDELDALVGPEPAGADLALRTAIEAVVLLSGMDEKSTVRSAGERFRGRPDPAGVTAEERQLLALLSSLGTLRTFRHAEEPAEQARRVLRISDVESGGWALMGSALSLYMADDNESALAALGLLIEHAQATGQAWTYCLATSTRAIVRHWTGDLAEALADGQSCYDVLVQESWVGAMTMPQTSLAMALIRQGEAARADELLRAIDRARFGEFTFEYHPYLMARAWAREALGDPAGALEILLHCGESLSEAGITNPVFAAWWYDAARILAALGRHEEGQRIAEHGAELAARWGTSRARGMALTARGVVTPGEEGLRLLSSAVRTLADSPGKLAHAEAEYLLGRRLLAEGDAEGARGHLRSSLDMSVLRRDRRQVALSSAALLAAGGRLRRGTGSPADALSGSERRVADRAAEGATNREIAESLFLTVRTVELHLTSAYRKLGVRGRAALPAALVEQAG